MRIKLDTTGLFGAITAKRQAASSTSYVTASMLSAGAVAVIISALSSRAMLASTSFITFLEVLVTQKSFYYGLGVAATALYLLFWVAIINIYDS